VHILVIGTTLTQMRHVCTRYAMDKDQNKTNNFHMRVDDEFLALLDALRKAEADLPSRAEIIRRLVERAAPQEKRKRK
jgi:hypothetical protein